jgi:hypothetical protein
LSISFLVQSNVTSCISVVIAQMACLALAFRWPRFNHGDTTYSLTRSSASFSKTLLALVSILSVLGTIYRWPSSPPQPFKPGPRVLNAGIWTLHFGIDNTGRDSQRGVTDLIRCVPWPSSPYLSELIGVLLFRDMQLDIVGFLETNLHVSFFGPSFLFGLLNAIPFIEDVLWTSGFVSRSILLLTRPIFIY